MSVVSDSFYKEHVGSCQLNPITSMFHIECADGQELPYSGFIEADLSIRQGLPKAQPLSCILHVVPDTKYSRSTSLILGTNVLNELLQGCAETFGCQFLQKAGLFTPWYLCFRAIILRHRELALNKNRIAIIRSDMLEKIVLHPNETLNIKGYTDKIIDHPSTTAIVHESEESHLPSHIEVTPAVVQHHSGSVSREVTVTLSNTSREAIVISPKSILCEMQPVVVADDVLDDIEKSQDKDDIIRGLHVDDDSILEEDQKGKLFDLLRQHSDIFSTGETDIGQCNLVKHRIDMTDEIPFKQRHRRIPPSMIEEVRQHIEQLLAGGIISPSKSPWTSNVVLVRKKNGTLRLCVDYRMLNNRTLRRMEEIFDC